MLTQVCGPNTQRASRVFTDGQHWLPGLCPLGVPRLARDPLSTTALLPCTATKDVKMCPSYTEGPWAVTGLFPISRYPVPSLSTRGLSSVSWPSREGFLPSWYTNHAHSGHTKTSQDSPWGPLWVCRLNKPATLLPFAVVTPLLLGSHRPALGSTTPRNKGTTPRTGVCVCELNEPHHG